MKRQRTKWPSANGNGTTSSKGGRPWPPLYDPETHPIKAYQLTSMFGCTNAQLAELFGVSIQAIEQWTRNHPEFKVQVRAGRDEYHTEGIERTLARRASGYEYHEKVYEYVEDPKTGQREKHLLRLTKKHMPPDPTSIIFYLKCRKPERWHDPIQQHKHQVEQINLNVNASLTDMLGQVGDPSIIRQLRDTVAALPYKPVNGEAKDGG